MLATGHRTPFQRGPCGWRHRHPTHMTRISWMGSSEQSHQPEPTVMRADRQAGGPATRSGSGRAGPGRDGSLRRVGQRAVQSDFEGGPVAAGRSGRRFAGGMRRRRLVHRDRHRLAARAGRPGESEGITSVLLPDDTGGSKLFDYLGPTTAPAPWAAVAASSAGGGHRRRPIGGLVAVSVCKGGRGLCGASNGHWIARMALGIQKCHGPCRSLTSLVLARVVL